MTLEIKKETLKNKKSRVNLLVNIEAELLLGKVLGTRVW